MIGVAALMLGATGCDDSPQFDEQFEQRHAESHGIAVADDTIAAARQWVLLHPQSERQRHAREQLLRLQDLQESMPDHHAAPQRSDIERQLQSIDQWRDSISPDAQDTP